MKGLDSVTGHLLAARRWPVAGKRVNLIPTVQGGTHVNGLRTGLVEALREFCEPHNLAAGGLRLAPEDVWDKVGYILSVKLTDPQFSGQTKNACRPAPAPLLFPALSRMLSACG